MVCLYIYRLSTERLVAHTLYFSLFPPGVKIDYWQIRCFRVLSTWPYEAVCMHLKMRVSKCCTMSLFEYVELKYVSSCISYRSSRSVRPCEPTTCVGVAVCKFKIVCLRVNLLCVLGLVLRVCDPLSCELRRVAVELQGCPRLFSFAGLNL